MKRVLGSLEVVQDKKSRSQAETDKSREKITVSELLNTETPNNIESYFQMSFLLVNAANNLEKQIEEKKADNEEGNTKPTSDIPKEIKPIFKKEKPRKLKPWDNMCKKFKVSEDMKSDEKLSLQKILWSLLNCGFKFD